MLRRTALKSRQRREWEAKRASRAEREPKTLHRLERPASFTGGTTGPAPKEHTLESPAYERAAKSLGYCMRCGVQVVPLTGQLDFCHADLGKGQGIKTDPRRGWPGCRDCHEHVGRRLTKPVRRAVEYLLGVMTRAAVQEAGLWPKRLPKLEEA